MSNQLLDHMDRWTRAKRLYEKPKNAGLWVEPVYAQEEKADIEYIRVGVAPPRIQHDQG